MHVLKTMPKSQFIRLQSICLQKSGYLLNSKIMGKNFIERRIREKELKKTIKHTAKIDKNELLRDRTRESKGPQTIIVSTWLGKLNAIPFVLKNNFHLFSNDP